MIYFLKLCGCLRLLENKVSEKLLVINESRSVWERGENHYCISGVANKRVRARHYSSIQCLILVQ